MSASLTSVTTSILSKSATVIITVPGLFIVPVITNSPTSALSAIITPSIGDVIVVWLSWSAACSTWASEATSWWPMTFRFSFRDARSWPAELSWAVSSSKRHLAVS